MIQSLVDRVQRVSENNCTIYKLSLFPGRYRPKVDSMHCEQYQHDNLSPIGNDTSWLDLQSGTCTDAITT